MRIVVIGASGHVGSYLTPRLVRSGHDVVAVSRGTSRPYVDDPAWDAVTTVTADREAEDAAGTFGGRIRDLHPDVVIDMICFTRPSAEQLADALRGEVAHLLHCGTIWTHGLSTSLPLREDDEKHPFGDYGVQKHAIERYLLAQSEAGDLPTTVIHPGHISGPGWPVITPVGNLDARVWTSLATGTRLRIPGTGAETMHHVHADDVAQLFELAVCEPESAIGQSFHAVAARAMTVRGYAAEAASWFGRDADLEPVSWDDFRDAAGADHADASWQHLVRSHVASIEKAQSRLGYHPRFTTGDAAREAVDWMIEHDGLDVGGPLGAPTEP